MYIYIATGPYFRPSIIDCMRLPILNLGLAVSLEANYYCFPTFLHVTNRRILRWTKKPQPLHHLCKHVYFGPWPKEGFIFPRFIEISCMDCGYELYTSSVVSEVLWNLRLAGSEWLNPPTPGPKPRGPEWQGSGRGPKQDYSRVLDCNRISKKEFA